MKKITPKTAFSLIEISIVILIIGILIAGITQATSLVGKFKLSTARNLTKSGPVSGIQGLVAWWETTSEESFLSSETGKGLLVSSWTDISPQTTVRNIATQVTDASKPTYDDGAINGLPALLFKRTNDDVGTYLALPYNSAMQPSQLTVFAVVKLKSDSTTDGAIFSARNMVSSMSGYTLYSLYSSNLNVVQLWLHSGASFGNDSPLTGTISSNTAQVISATYDGAIMNLYGNGISTGAPQTRPYTPSLTAVFRIGIGSSGDGSSSSAVKYPFDGHIGEIIIYNRALKTDERKDVEKYLGKKWGVAVS